MAIYSAQVWFMKSQGKLEVDIPGEDEVQGGAFPGYDSYVQLARDCLARDPSARPTFAAITDRIR